MVGFSGHTFYFAWEIPQLISSLYLLDQLVLMLDSKLVYAGKINEVDSNKMLLIVL
jgi:hypothetical protein